MTRLLTILGFLLACVAGGACAKVPAGPPGADRAAALEAKAQRLEEDFRAAAIARDQFRQKLAAAEDQLAAVEARIAQLLRQLDESRGALAAVTRERDALKADLTARTAERDAVTAQYDAFRKSLRELLGQAESARVVPTAPGVATAGPTTGPQPGS